MRQAVLLALTINLFFLSACSGVREKQESFSAWREGYLSTENHVIKAKVSQSGQGAESFGLIYTLSEGKQTVEITEPETLAGIRAGIVEEGAELCYEGLIFAVGAAGEKYSPMTALPLFHQAVTQGGLSLVWTEKTAQEELLAGRLQLADGGTVTVYLAENGTKPVFAAISQEERVILKIELQEMT